MDAEDMKSRNERVIRQFRANGGEVESLGNTAPLLLLTTTGAKSGRELTTPLGYGLDGERMIVFASVLGAPKNPAWYHNLLAHPDVRVEVGDEVGEEDFAATATVVEGEERERLWKQAAEEWPFLEEHQARTERRIPVVALERRESGK